MEPIRILFVCHGNICRSPMAEFVMKDLVRKKGLEDCFVIASAATSAEEIGNDIHHGTKRMLDKMGVPYERRAARRLRSTDANAWDCIVGMDEANMRNMGRMLGRNAEGKLYKMLEFTGSNADVADPWYTGNFEETYDGVLAGCRGLLAHLGF